MAVKKIRMRPEGTNDYGDILHPETSADLVIASDGVTTFESHLAEKVHQGEVHGLRINDDKELEFFDGIEWKPSYFSSIPPPDDISGAPGSKHLISGDMQAGFFGEVSASELISGDALASLVGISQGTSQHSTAGWLKFAWQGKILFVAKKPFRYSISWVHINSANAVYGDKTVEIDGLTYKIRLMKGALTNPSEYEDPDRGAHGSEWNRLMLPIHEQAIDESWNYPEYVENDIPVWSHNLGSGNQGMYTDEDLLTRISYGNGSFSWCQETRKDDTAYRVIRGYGGVSDSRSGPATSTDIGFGWRPCLELVP